MRSANSVREQVFWIIIVVPLILGINGCSGLEFNNKNDGPSLSSPPGRSKGPEASVNLSADLATKVKIYEPGTDFIEGNSTTLTVVIVDSKGDVITFDNTTRVTFVPTGNAFVTDVLSGTGDGVYNTVGGPETVTVTEGIARVSLANGVDESFEVEITNDSGLSNPPNDAITSTPISPFRRQLGNSTMGSNADQSEQLPSQSLIRDKFGNIFVAGQTRGELGSEVSSGSNDVVLAKFDSSGTMAWVKQLGQNTVGPDAVGHEYVCGMAQDSFGNIYVAGYTLGTLGGEANAGSYDVFLAKFNSEGDKEWVTQLGNSTAGLDAARRDYCSGVTADSLGNIFVTGNTRGSLGAETNGGIEDVFVAKFDSGGAIEWVSQLGDVTMGPDADGSDMVTGIALDSSGNIFVTGHTSGTLGGETNGGGFDVFVAKFGSDGASEWVSQLGDVTLGVDADGQDRASGIALDNTGNIFVTGYTSGTLGQDINGGGYDVIVAKFDSAGASEWVSQLGTMMLGADSNGQDFAGGIAIDSSGKIYLSGYTKGSLGGEPNAGSTDLFFAKLNSSGGLD
jgi:hypothetical protein